MLQTQLRPEPSSALTVSQLNDSIKKVLEGQFPKLWVRGEISNFKHHSSGHLYFSLKDSQSQIRAVMFRGHNAKLRFRPQDGLEVLCFGQISVYAPKGDYQVYVEHMEPLGAGLLQRMFEELKQKLAKEGLFDSARKRPIPRRPRKIGVITSPTGAAIRDILNILGRRAPSIPVVLIPALVQGASAASDLIRALEEAQKIPNLDVLIIGRGGGSLEDMWCFNDEALARKIAAFPVPVISAVGHEIDFTISDFVADLRAPTPSAAAELVAQSDQDIRGQFQQLENRISLLIKRWIAYQKEKLRLTSARLKDPSKHLKDLLLKRDDLLDRLLQSQRRIIEGHSRHLNHLAHRIKVAYPKVLPLIERIQELHRRLDVLTSQVIQKKSLQFAKLSSILDSVSPLRILARGYCFQTDQEGRIIKSAKELHVGRTVRNVYVDGQADLQVLSITLKEDYHGI